MFHQHNQFYYLPKFHQNKRKNKKYYINHFPQMKTVQFKFHSINFIQKGIQLPN